MKSRRRTNRGKAAGAELAADYCENGVTQREFCERRGISVGTLQYWLRKIARDEAEGQPVEPQWVEVSLSKAEPVVSPKTREGGSYEAVLTSARRLRIPAGFDAGEVAVLIGLLEARAC